MSYLKVALKLDRAGFSLNAHFNAPVHGITALFGPSGSGKTTVLRAIAGLERTATGVIQLNDSHWQGPGTFVPPHRRRIGYVFQEASLFSHLSVEQNLRYGWKRLPSGPRNIDPRRVMEILELERLVQRPTAGLSGGERQRVAIGRALLHDPCLLLLDEPLSALDGAAKQEILPYLNRLQDELAVPMIYVSHDLREVGQLADHMVLLKAGRVVTSGPAAELLARLDLADSDGDALLSFLEGRVSHHEADFGLSWFTVSGESLAAYQVDLPCGRHARLQVLARDVSIALRSHHDSSIINRLTARVVATRDLTMASTLVQLELLDGQPLLSLITRRSALAMGLAEGMPVIAQIKGVAVKQ